MDPSNLPEVTKAKATGFSKWLVNFRDGGNDNPDGSVATMKRLMRRTRSAPTMDPQADDSTSGRRGGGGVVGHAPFRRPQRIERASAVKSEGSVHGSVPSTIIMQSSLADKFLGPATTTVSGEREKLPFMIIHPLDWRYRQWWYTTVVVAAIASILEPYTIAFTPPGLYPYNSATSIIEYTTMVLIVIDMCLSFNVARFHQGILITDRRSLARNYTRILFWVDLLSVIPFDEISLAIAGLNGTKYVNNPVKAQYLSLFKLFRMLRMYRLWWFFSYLTYNLAAPLILVTILRNLYLTYFFANFAACTWYFEARQAGLGVNTWVGGYTALAQLSDGIGDMFHQSSAADMYAWSMYWSVVTMATLGYGDIRAYNTVEAVLVMVWSLFSFFFAAYIIGSITLVVVKGDEKAGLYRDQMQVLQKFSAQHDLPEDIGESMLRHLKLHLNNQHISEEAVLAPYPTSIRRQVLRYLYLPALDQAYLFAGAKKRFLDALLAAARVELYLPRVEILSEGDFVSDLYILVAGEILQGGIGALNTLVANAPEPASGDKTPKTSSQDEVPVDIEKAAAPATQYATPPSILREGDVFGEIAFFTGTAQLRGATTLTVVRVLAISRSAYDQVASTFKSSARHVLNHLSRSAEEATMDMFPGAGGLDVYKKAMAAAEAGEIGEGWNDPTWHLSAKDAKSLRLSLQQEAAIGNYVRVKQVVAQRVAQYDEDFTAEFLYAASRGEVVKMTEALDHGFNINACDYDARTAVMLAAGRGHEEALEMLLRHGANPNAIDIFKGLVGHSAKNASVLCAAVADGDLMLLRRLLLAGADANDSDYDDRTALHIACAEGNVAAVEILVVEGKADPHKRDRWGLTAAEEAERVGAHAVSMFLASQPTQEEVDHDGGPSC